MDWWCDKIINLYILEIVWWTLSTWLKLNSLIEATSTAKEALTLLPNTSRTLYLAGLVMFNTPSQSKKVFLY